MVYNEFVETMKQALKDRFGAGYSVKVHQVPKNNGVLLDGLSILPPDSLLAPTIYLNPYYEQHLQGVPEDQILDEIFTLFTRNPPPCAFSTDQLTDFEPLKTKVLMKLVHADSNHDLLAEIPYVKFLDLAVIFYLLLEKNDDGQMTLLINNEHLKLWNISRKELFRLALANTPLACPAQIQSMNEAIRESAMQSLGDSCDETVLEKLMDEEDCVSPLYVLSNTSGIYGACCLLYRDLLKDFAESIGSDLILIPSSIHEILIAPLEDGASFNRLNAMVSDINASEVPPEDQLSDHIYLYTRGDDRIQAVLPPENLTRLPR